jgi:hypothetical protein
MDKVESIKYHTVGTYNQRITQTHHAHIHGLGVSTVVLWAHIIVSSLKLHFVLPNKLGR